MPPLLKQSNNALDIGQLITDRAKAVVYHAISVATLGITCPFSLYPEALRNEISGLDLNLLVALDALLRTQNVSRAANAVHVTQQQ